MKQNPLRSTQQIIDELDGVTVRMGRPRTAAPKVKKYAKRGRPKKRIEDRASNQVTTLKRRIGGKGLGTKYLTKDELKDAVEKKK